MSNQYQQPPQPGSGLPAYQQPPQRSSGGGGKIALIIIGVVGGLVLLCCGGGLGAAYLGMNMIASEVEVAVRAVSYTHLRAHET